VAAYEGWHHQPPNRIVVHKWQRYFDDEKAGFAEAITTQEFIPTTSSPSATEEFDSFAPAQSPHFAAQ
jgi:hypothetical protein